MKRNLIKNVSVDFSNETITFNRGIISKQYKMTSKGNSRLLKFIFRNNLNTFGNNNFFVLDTFLSGYYP
jgi:hypothetical protein